MTIFTNDGRILSNLGLILSKYATVVEWPYYQYFLQLLEETISLVGVMNG